MGCSHSKVRVVKPSNVVATPSANEEIEEVANLPIRAKADDSDLVSIVELTVRCTDLQKADGSPATDSMVVCYLQDEEEYWVEKKRTEVVRSTASPMFITAFTVSYSFERKQRFKLDAYDFSTMQESKALANHELLGSAVFNIHEVVCSPTQSISRTLLHERGTITVTSEETRRLNHTLRMQWKLLSASRVSPVFFRLSRALEIESFVPFYESERITGPDWEWEPFETTVSAFCRGIETRKVLFELFRARKMNSQLLGSFELTLADLKYSGSKFEAPLMLKDRIINRVSLLDYVYAEKASFLDYIYTGCEISLVIGLDFTRSNGTPDSQRSLHYLPSADSDNEYIKAIRAVGDILQYYDSDKRIPVFGFGAKLPPYFDVVSHCFALNGNTFDPEVLGIEKVVEVYRRACKEVVFHGPTVFSHLIKRVAEIAGAREVLQEQQQYFILLIITDGNINDLDATSHELVVASALPLSIIIVGVGEEDFSKMELLDADEKPLYSKPLKKFMERDIVQFVPFSGFKNNLEMLAKEVLFEVPNQLLSYMSGKGIKPGRPKKTTMDSVRRTTTQSAKGIASSTRHQHSILSPINAFSTPALLQRAKRKFIEDAVNLGFDQETVEETVDKGVPCADLNLLVELINFNRQRISQEKSRLKQENLVEILRSTEDNQNGDSLLCKVCFSRPVDVVLLECGHRVVCGICVKDLDMRCPACHRVIVSWIKSK